MEPKAMRFQTISGRKPILGEEEQENLAIEGRDIKQADRRDGTNAFLEAAFADVDRNEPDYEW